MAQPILRSRCLRRDANSSSGAAIDYIPSQYLCEFIKDCGFDGVVYRSSVSDGINLALFDPGRATGGTVSVVDVKKVSIETAPR